MIENTHSDRGGEYATKRTKFFSDFAISHIGALRLHKDQGLFPKKEGWRNVVEHCLVEAVAADCLSEVLHLSERNRTILVAGALLHDFYKRKEIELMRESGQTSVMVVKQTEDSATQYLQSKGISSDIIKIVNSVGAANLEYFETESPTMEEKLMHYIDDITDGDSIVSLEDRIASAIKRYPDLDADIAQRMLAVSKKIESEVAEMIGLDDARELPNFIKGKIEERINNY